MLNEGYYLYKSLERCGIRLTNRHPDVKEPGKKEGLIVGLNKKGEVTTLEYRKAEEVAQLWTTREGMHNSFPVLKLQRPLWKVKPNDPLRKKLAELKNNETEKRKLLSGEDLRLNITSAEKDWWKRLQVRVRYLLPYFETKDVDYTALYELARRFLLITDVQAFLQQLLEQLKQFQQDISYSLYENILIGNKLDKGKSEYRAEVPLIVDVSDWEKFSVRVASPKMEAFVSECLFKKQESETATSESSSKSKLPSALSGRILKLEDDKFPAPKLPIIGNTYLFAVNDQTPCQTRYGKTSTAIIPIGREEATAIQNSLNWTTDSRRQGKTWYSVPSIKEGERDLLVVYLDNKPDLQVNKAYMLGGVSKDYFSESHYEAIASTAINALRGERSVNANDLIHLFALHKADPGRTQVSLQRTYTISDLIRADKEWRQAAANIPKVSFPFFRREIERMTAHSKHLSNSISQLLSGKEAETIFLSPRCPFPADLVRLTQKQWIRFGQESTPLPSISLGDVYDVFFGQTGQSPMAENLLILSLQRTQSLLIGLGNADHKRQMVGYSTDARFTTLLTISVLGICLYKLGIRKENYMKDTFFYVGRFLSLLDTLHFEWCKHVRGGYPENEEKDWRKAIPPQLLGSAHLNIALDSPSSALDILSRRIKPYKDWTRKEQSATVALARWCIGEIGEICSMLADKTNPLPTSTTSAERAQILLGYLARSEQKENIEFN